MKKSIATRMNKDILLTFVVIAVLFIIFGILMQLHWRNENIRMVVHFLDTVVTREQNNLANELFEKRITSLNMRLGEMRDIEHIVHVALYDQDRGFLTSASGLSRENDALMAATLADADLFGTDGAYQVTGGVHSLYFARPITAVGETLGWIAIVYDLSLLRKQILSFFFFYSALLAVTLLCMLVMLRRRLRQSVVSPLTQLGESMRTIQAGQPVSLRDFEGADRELYDLLGSFQDMAARLSTSYQELDEANRTLHASEKSYRDIFDSSSDALFVHELETGKILDVNERMLSLFGYSDKSEVCECDAELLSAVEEGYDIARAVQEMKSAAQKGFNTFEWRSKKKNGELFWAQVTLNRVRVRGVERILAAVRDISEHKRAEEALKHSEATYRAIFNAVNDALYIHDIETGEILDVNQTVLEKFGFSREEMRGKIVGDLSSGIPPYTQEQANELIRKAIAGEPQIFEWHCRRQDGHLFWMETSLKRVTIAGKECILAIQKDITDRKMAEAENEKLQSQLLHAQKMESVGILAGGVAHDFNNLLQAMRGNIELLLLKKQEDHPDAARLHAVTRSMDRAAELVHQLLLFGRRAGARRTRVDMNQEVEGVARMLEQAIPKMISLELHLDPSVYPLFADPVQIEQVLLNLARNASDAMPEGGKLLMETKNATLDEEFVRMHPGSTVGHHVLLTVSDTGCGMDKETLAQIFDPFFTTKQVGKGTGLGLSSVYGIVKSHGGYIQCYSEPNQGTTFRVYLPVVDQGDAATAEPPPQAPVQGGSETILVVDDEQDIRELTREVLESLGYAVKSAASGEEALEIFTDDGQNIDLVVLDLNMPGMGGHKCLQELLRLNPKVKVVVASGYTANGHGRDTLSAGAKDFITKPYRLQELAIVVRKVLDKKEAGIVPGGVDSSTRP